MFNEKAKGALFTALLLLSIVSAIYLVLSNNIPNCPTPLGTVKSSTSQDTIGLVEISGPIYVPYEESGLWGSSGFSGIIKVLTEFRKNKNIKGVILRINSPGGTIASVQEITREIGRLKEAGKPVVASIADIGASGGYYIASSCDKIIANPGSIIGSIGVIMVSSDISELLDKLGIKMQVIKSGRFKDMGSFHRPYNREESEMLKEMLTDAHNQFVEAVVKGRNMPEAEVKKLSQGQIYSGKRAKDLGLIDFLGDQLTAKSKVEELAGIKDSRIVQKHYSKWQKVFRLIENKARIYGLLKEKGPGIGYFVKL